MKWGKTIQLAEKNNEVRELENYVIEKKSIWYRMLQLVMVL